MEIPFCTLVEVKLSGLHGVDVHDPDEVQRVLKELVCKLKRAEVVAECVEEIRHDDDGCICKIIEKDVVRVEVKVERLEEILVSAGACPSFDNC